MPVPLGRGEWPVLVDDHMAPMRRLIAPALDQSEPSVSRLNVVLNWFEELKQRVPTGR